MSIPHTYSFTRYLTAKKSVDDRALNRYVWQILGAALPRATPEKPLQILEIGAGLGSMVERLCAGSMLTHATYTAIDLEPTLIAEARRRLPQWATAQGLQVQQDSQAQIHVQRPGQDISAVVLEQAADCSGPAAGTRVVALTDNAGWAQRAAVPAHRMAALPDNVRFEEAAALPVAGLTALRALPVACWALPLSALPTPLASVLPLPVE